MLSIIIAPAMPFIAEEVFLGVREEEDSESVHLTVWPEIQDVPDTEILTAMARVRALVSEALMLRQKVGIKVRQPLAKLTVLKEVPEDLKIFILDEINVKDIVVGSKLELDIELTPELIREGDEREMASAIAQARKAEGFSPNDVAHANIKLEGKYKVQLSTGEVCFDLTKDAA